MKSKLDCVTDCNSVANGIMREIVDVYGMERMLDSELSSEDLFRIDCAILTSLRNTEDFSRDLLFELESGMFKSIIERPPIVSDLSSIQQDTMIDFALRLMFSDMSEFVTKELL